MADHDYRNGGFRHKYHITKADGTPCDPAAVYFVLRIDEDPHARRALSRYADSVEKVNPQFAQEIRELLKNTFETFKKNYVRAMEAGLVPCPLLDVAAKGEAK